MCLPHTSRSSMNMFSFYFVSKEEAKTNDSFYSCADKHFASIYFIWIFGLAFEWQLFSSVCRFYFAGGCAMNAELHRHFTSFTFVLTSNLHEEFGLLSQRCKKNRKKSSHRVTPVL